MVMEADQSRQPGIESSGEWVFVASRDELLMIFDLHHITMPWTILIIICWVVLTLFVVFGPDDQKSKIGDSDEN